jgi:predicted RNase H-like HicB family nuclease
VVTQFTFLRFLAEKREGDDIDDALANIQEAIELYLEPVDDGIAVQEGAIIRELVV